MAENAGIDIDVPMLWPWERW